MSIYKEAVHAVNLIKRNSQRIYPDAADYGASVKKGDEIWNWAKQLVECYGVKGSRRVTKYGTGTSVTSLVEYMPDEHHSPRVVQVRVTYTTTRQDKFRDGYITIE